MRTLTPPAANHAKLLCHTCGLVLQRPAYIILYLTQNFKREKAENPHKIRKKAVFRDLVIDSNKSRKEKGVRCQMRKKKSYIAYDYEKAYTETLENMHEWLTERIFAGHKKKMVYALKEIRAGDQMEVEIYPQFRKMEDVSEEGRKKKDNSKAQRNLNDKNAKKYIERLINENFGNQDIWMTLTYDDEHLPPDGDIDAAIKNVQRYIARVNYQRKKRGLPKARYIYVTAYDPGAKIRWHHHIVMDGALDMGTVEKCWKQSSRNEVRRLQKDENGLSGMANYIVEEKNRCHGERRWNSSKGLREPKIRVVHSKRPTPQAGYKKISTYVDGMVRNHNAIRDVLKGWYPDMEFTNAEVKTNSFNCAYYIHARMRKQKEEKDDGKTKKVER